jgi:hypothetical protein
MQTVNRQEIFSHLKARLTLVDKNIDLIWCADLVSMKNIAVNHFQDENYIFLNFGECLIFNHFKIKLSTSKTTDKGLKFTEIGGALNNIEEARELHNQFEQILGLADHFSESYGEIFTY